MEITMKTTLGRCRKRLRRTVEWVELPREVTMSILRRLDQAEVLTSVQFVCATWLHICRDPQMWRSIELRAPIQYPSYSLPGDDAVRGYYANLCLQALRYSSGHLTEITMDAFATDRLLLYICERSSKLKSLRLRHCASFSVSPRGLLEAIEKLPFLEDLEFQRTVFPATVFEVIARCCPNLKTLKYNCHDTPFTAEKLSPLVLAVGNSYPFYIAQNFPRLRHLELIGVALDDDGLRAILDGCPHLESLDLLFCIHLDLSGDLLERCYKQIKYLRLPLDGVLDEINRVHVPYVAPHYFFYVLNTLQERKPSLSSASVGRVVQQNRSTEQT